MSGLLFYPRHNRKTFFHLAAVTLVLLIGLPGLASAISLTSTSSFPVITELEPPEDRSLEGSVTVRVVSDVDITPVTTPAWLVKISSRIYETHFLWNDTEARLVQMADTQGDTVTAEFLPETRMPFDLSLHEMPVLHITTEPASLWDMETGIYAWGNYDNFLQKGSEWERPAQVVYYDESGAEVFSEPIGLRINGGSSRYYHQKGLRLYFDDYGDSDVVEYDFFGEGPIRFERLVLRGNRYADFAIGSGVNEPLHRDLGHPGSRHRTVAVYLNNQYWGMYSLRERLDSKFVETTWEYADDDYFLLKDNEAQEGDYAVWEDFQGQFAPPGNFASHAWFEEISAQLDLTSYIDWHLVNVCGASSDNTGGKNMAILKIGGDRWTYMAWDEDLLYQNGNLQAEHLRFYSAADAQEFALFLPPVWFSGGPWPWTWDWNNMLRSLMQNAEFKSLLRARSSELFGDYLSVPSLRARVDSLAAIQGPEWINQGTRWSLSTSYYESRLIQVRAFMAGRAPVVVDQVNDFLELWAQPVELTAFSGQPTSKQVALSWRTEREDGCLGFRLERATGSPDDFVVVASWPDVPDLAAKGGIGVTAEYVYPDTTSAVGQPLFYRLSYLDQDLQVVGLDWLVDLTPPASSQLRLNELLASNDTQGSDEAGEFDDWLEIYNPGPEPVPTGGLFLTDDLENTAQWPLPDLELLPGDYLLVWCDEDLDQGPLHANFKLSAGGESVALYSGFAAGHQPIDVQEFGAQTTDVSWGRQNDGEEPWVFFAEPTPGSSNQPASPANHEVVILGARLSTLWPNPASGSVQARLSSGGMGAQPFEVIVYDLRGRQVRRLIRGLLPEDEQPILWDRRDNQGRRVPSGTYLFRLKAAGLETVRRVVLVH